MRSCIRQLTRLQYHFTSGLTAVCVNVVHLFGIDEITNLRCSVHSRLMVSTSSSSCLHPTPDLVSTRAVYFLLLLCALPVRDWKSDSVVKMSLMNAVLQSRTSGNLIFPNLAVRGWIVAISRYLPVVSVQHDGDIRSLLEFRVEMSRSRRKLKWLNWRKAKSSSSIVNSARRSPRGPQVWSQVCMYLLECLYVTYQCLSISCVTYQYLYIREI